MVATGATVSGAAVGAGLATTLMAAVMRGMANPEVLHAPPLLLFVLVVAAMELVTVLLLLLLMGIADMGVFGDLVIAG